MRIRLLFEFMAAFCNLVLSTVLTPPSQDHLDKRNSIIQNAFIPSGLSLGVVPNIQTESFMPFTLTPSTPLCDFRLWHGTSWLSILRSLFGQRCCTNRSHVFRTVQWALSTLVRRPISIRFWFIQFISSRNIQYHSSRDDEHFPASRGTAMADNTSSHWIRGDVLPSRFRGEH